MKKKIFTLLTFAFLSIGTAWATDYTLGATTFNSAKTIATVGGLDFTFSKAHGGAGQTGYSEYIKFSKNAAYTITLPDGFELSNINIKGYTNSSGITNGEIISIGGNDQTGKTFPAKDDANLATNTCITDGYDFAISQTGGEVEIKTANTNQICVLITITGTAAAAVAVDPVFSLSRTTISTLQTAQIKVGTKDGLDGIALSSITYGTPGIVNVDAETGVVTPVAVGTTTINFNSAAVADKYNAKTGNSLTITVTEAVTVFDAAGLTNAQILLSKANIEDKDYLACNSSYWADKGWTAPYNGNFLDMKTDRKITFTVKNATTFELYLNGGGGREYKIKVGDADAVIYTQSGDGSGFVSSGVIATGTKDEVTIEIEGGSNTLYPVYFLINPVVEASVDATYGWSTFVSDKALDFTGISDVKAYIVTGHTGTAVDMTQMTGSVPANTPLLLEGSTTVVPALVSSSTDVSANLLKAGTGADVAAEEGKTKYVLSANGGVATFLKINGTAATVPTGKAYLEFTGSVPASYLNLDNSGATGIETLNMISADGSEVYNLSGQRVAQPTKGLYIVNGKKVIIK